MGQAANSNRNATLDQKKDRAAGRIKERAMREMREDLGAPPRGKAAGASGKHDVANPRGRGGQTRGAGGGGGAQSRPKDAAIAGKVRTGRSTRPARKGGT